MLVGRFLMIVPALAIAGSMVGKKIVPAGPGTFPTNGALFAVLLVAVILIVGALTFFPALSLGPIVEHFLGAPRKGVLAMASKPKSLSLFDPAHPAPGGPRRACASSTRGMVAKNPVMFVVEVGSVLTTAALAPGPDRPPGRRRAGLVHAGR